MFWILLCDSKILNVVKMSEENGKKIKALWNKSKVKGNAFAAMRCRRGFIFSSPGKRQDKTIQELYVKRECYLRWQVCMWPTRQEIYYLIIPWSTQQHPENKTLLTLKHFSWTTHCYTSLFLYMNSWLLGLISLNIRPQKPLGFYKVMKAKFWKLIKVSLRFFAYISRPGLYFSNHLFDSDISSVRVITLNVS